MRRKRSIKKENKKLILLGLLLVIAVGYALLAVTLNINGFTAFKGQNWKIYWDDIEEVDGSVDGNATIVGEKKTSIVVNAEFDALGQYYEFTVDAVNDGDFNAMVDVITTDFYKVENGEDISIDKPDFINCDYEYVNGKSIKIGDVLQKQSNRKYVIRVSTIDEVDSIANLPDSMELKTVITINYVKTDKGTITLKKGPEVSNIMYNLVYDAHRDDIGELCDSSYGEGWRYSNIDKITSYIEHFKMATDEQYNEVKDSLTSDNLISLTTENPSDEMIQIATNAAVTADDTTSSPVYMWYDKDSSTVYYYSELETIYLNEDSSYMFYDLNNAYDIELTKFDTKNVMNMMMMFKSSNNYNLSSLDLSNFDTSNATNMSYMFSGLENIDLLDVSNFDTKNVTNMSYMFSNLTNVRELDLSNFDTSNVTNMSMMFNNCGSLTNLNLENFDTSNVTNMSGMFSNNGNLSNLNLINFNTSKVTDMNGMFAGWGTAELDLSSFDTSNVTNMHGMFMHIDLTSIDLTNFDTRNVESMVWMFAWARNLENIYVGENWSTSKVNYSSNMFEDDNKLIGRCGTTYDTNYKDKEYARMDSFENPGYLSEKASNIVKYDANGGSVNPAYKKVNTGNTIGSLPTPTHGDNEFLGWYTAIVGGEEVDSTFVPTGYTVLYARWKYEIVFNPNEGTVSETSRITYSGVSLGTLPTPTREGYGFVGWYTGLTDGIRIGKNTIPTDSVTYYARWEPLKIITYKSTDGLFNNNENTNIVTYKYSEGGKTKYSHTSNINDEGVASGSYLPNLTTTDVVKIDGAESIRIDVWFSTENTSYDWLAIYPKNVIPNINNYSEATISNGKLGGGKYNYKPKNSNNYKSYIVDSDTAQFFFKSDSGRNYYGYYAIISDNTSTGYHALSDYLVPVNGDKLFSWNTRADGSGTTYLTEDDIIADFANLDDNVTLYAQWRDKENYTITFNPNGGTVSEPSRTVLERDEIGTLPVPTNGDNLFVGWYTGLTDGVYVDSTYIPTKNETLYARWSNVSSFANDDWSTIIAAVRAGKTNSYSVGDTKEIDLGDFGVHTVRIANMDTQSECSDSDYSQSACGFVIEFADIITTYNMNIGSDTNVNGSSNKGGWQYSQMRSYVNNSIYNELPIDLRRGIIDTKVVSGYGRYDSSNFTTIDKLYLLSIKEVYGSNIKNYDNAANLTHQLDYYSNNNVSSNSYSVVRKKYNSNNDYWWLRTAYGYGYFNVVYSNGYVDYYSYSNAYGVSPAFRLG